MSPATFKNAVECLKQWARGTPVKQIEIAHGMGRRSFYMLKKRFSQQHPDVFAQLLKNVESNTLQN